MKFRKKQVVVDAVQWNGNNYDEISNFFFSSDPNEELGRIGDRLVIHFMSDSDIDAKCYAHIGDWIVRGVKGEMYPCKPDIFALTHETEGEVKYTPEQLIQVAAHTLLPKSNRKREIILALIRVLEEAD